MRWQARKPFVKDRARRWWHPWFAWRPVKFPSEGRRSRQTWVWLETIQRRGFEMGELNWYWEYR